MPPRSKVYLIVAGAAALIVCAVFLVMFVSMKSDSNGELCRANLAVIYLGIRSGELFDSPKWDAAGTGRVFLASQDKWPSYQHRSLDLCCPVKGTRQDIDYRGPARPIREIPKGQPIVADRPGNHGKGQGGNVLLKEGQVHVVAEKDALWAAAEKTTSD